MSENPQTKLVAKLKRAGVLNSVNSLLGWDEQANLPPESADLRAEQSALMSELAHQAATDPEIGQLLAELEAGKLEGDVVALVREARRDYDQSTKIPPEFAAERATVSSKAFHAWAEARGKSDFNTFAPHLEKQLELSRRQAEYLGWGDRPYDCMIDLHDPGMTAAQIDELFAELKEGLVPLVRDIAASPVKAPADLFKGFPVETQRAFLMEVVKQLGFNTKRGRLDVSLHPFCSGSGRDIRMTTRFDADNPLDALFSSIHETGHALYEQGVNLDEIGTPLGEAVGMAIHESQSRMWENQVCRSRAFWQWAEPRFRAKFPEQLKDVSSEELYLAINAVELQPIRVDADEVTYNLHIILRFELEKRLFAGELKIADLPTAWRKSAKEMLGLDIDKDSNGVLQDVHWSGGAFGYFPSYCLGNMIAAQVWYTVQRELPGLEEDFARGEFGRLLEWLRAKIHRKGRRLNTRELVKDVTGQELSPKSLLRYLHERYGPLYLK
jgi:carboxypeptidase Taq